VGGWQRQDVRDLQNPVKRTAKYRKTGKISPGFSFVRVKNYN
jgi:hypothetical protein